MSWDIKLLVTLSELTTQSMHVMHIISTYVLYVIHGPAQYSTNQWLRNCQNTCLRRVISVCPASQMAPSS
uniref:Uncharacterized protein n=1 Tax=Timema bartmani TaxID=61472 RepID=A0A7R9EUP2_9NEOP|nr:unnamed protein product [Timema bartmani]